MGVWKDRSISWKLLLNSLIFLLPLVVLFVFFLAGVNASIKFNSLEIAGNRVQAPLESVLRNLAVLQDAVDRNDVIGRRKAVEALGAGIEEYSARELRDYSDLRLGAYKGALGGALRTGWEHLRDGQYGEIFVMFGQVRDLIAYVGNTSNLILDPDLDTYYLMDVTLLAIPQTQDRLRQIADIAGMYRSRGTLGADQIRRLAVLGALLRESDHDRVVASTETAVAEDANFLGVDGDLQMQIPAGLKVWRTPVQGLAKMLESLGEEGVAVPSAADLSLAVAEARDASLEYWNLCRVTLDRLLGLRVASYERTRLLGTLLTALALVLAGLVAWRVLADIRAAIGATLAFGKALAAGDLTASAPPARRDEIGRIAASMESLRSNFHAILHREVASQVRGLQASMVTLTSSSQQISASSNQQAAAVREIISTMEDSDRLAKGIAGKVAQVADQAGDTRTRVDTGLDMVRANLQAMEDIRSSNDATLQAIRILDDRIENIRGIVDMINSITSQIRIIAFNAELEAVNAGEAGNNFGIVATEIRRLADRSTVSTGEIKQTLAQIRTASGNLGESARAGTDTMEKGRGISASLEELFSGIQLAADDSAASATQITGLIREQVSAFEQILLSLRQISGGIDGFVTATRGGSDSAKELRQMAGELQSLLGKFRLETPVVPGVPE